MAHVNPDAFSPEFWVSLMGAELPQAEATACQPVRVEEGSAKLFAGALNGPIAPGTKVGFQRRGDRIAVAETPDGVELPKAGWWDEGTCIDLPLPEDCRSLLPDGKPVPCLLVQRAGAVELMPLRVQEHAPDVLGPRLIDEVADGAVIRHVVKGYAYEEWTAERLAELEALVCAEPFARDPLGETAVGDDWIAWKTRNELLGEPAPGDDALRQRLEADIFAAQGENGSWDGHVVATAYGTLRALSVDVPPDDPRIQSAAQWLLAEPEPLARPGMWMLDEPRRQKWNARQSGDEEVDWLAFMVHHYTEADHELFRAQEPQQVIPSCTRNHHAGCDAMLHPSATAAYALCCCGHAQHPRVRAYANSMYQLSAMFGYFCACWGILDSDDGVEDIRDRDPDFNRRADERPVALASLPYGHGRDAEDLCALARLPRYPRIHRPDLSDTNGWSPYSWRDTGIPAHYALSGSYWENADCWAKANRALSQCGGWSGSVAELFGLFQCHLYQTCLGEWDQGYPSGIFRMIEVLTSQTRAIQAIADSPVLRFAKGMLLRSVPWLRRRQKDDGLWHLDELSRHGEQGRPPSPRLATWHIAAVLDEFGLLERLRPTT